MLTRRSRHPDDSSCQRRHELRFQLGLMIMTVDTDVALVAVAHFRDLPNICIENTVIMVRDISQSWKNCKSNYLVAILASDTMAL